MISRLLIDFVLMIIDIKKSNRFPALFETLMNDQLTIIQTGVLIWCYGAAYSPIDKFVAPGTKIAALAQRHNYTTTSPLMCAHLPKTVVSFGLEHAGTGTAHFCQFISFYH